MNKSKNTKLLASALLYSGIPLMGSSVFSAAYLEHIQPTPPPLYEQFQELSSKQEYLTSIKRFSLEDIANQEEVQKEIRNLQNISNQLQAIKNSPEFDKITSYESKRDAFRKYLSIPFVSIALGFASLIYFVKLEF